MFLRYPSDESDPESEAPSKQTKGKSKGKVSAGKSQRSKS
jgi:hypothetical protein